MNNKKNELLTSSEMTLFLIGCLIGVGIISLPADVAATAKQDSWISTVLGAAYPLYIVLIGSYIYGKHPNDTILEISRKCFGKMIGNSLNILFFLQFILYPTAIAAGFSNVVRVHAVPFLTPVKIFVVIFFLVAYASYKGLKVLGRTNEWVFFLTLLLVFISLSALKFGSLWNITPVFSAGAANILKGAKETAYAYGTIEILLLIHPFAADKKAITKSALSCVAITAFFYTWVVFITIYYLGVDVTLKNFWPFILAIESTRIPVINYFRYVYVFLWSIIVFKTISNDYFIASFIVNDLTKLNRRKICLFLFPLMVYLALKYQNRVIRSQFLEFAIPKVTAFNIIYISFVALWIFIKECTNSGSREGGKNEKK